jgi:endonuclease/exonuclease/phosphatase family metal-dependent hydrolase
VTSLLDAHGQDRAVLVMGDFNDEPEAATTQILLGPPGSEIGTGGYDQPDQGDGNGYGTSPHGSRRPTATAGNTAAGRS